MSQPPLVVKASYFIVDDKNSAADIDSGLFTHLFCGFATTIPLENFNKFEEFTEIVKRKNKNVQTLLSIGGDTSRKSYIDPFIEIARSLGFSGIDLAWEYPSTFEEMNNYEHLLKDWREAVKKDADQTHKTPLLLTGAVFYSPVIGSLKYPVQAIAKNLDWVNIKAWNFYTPRSSKVTGPAAALFDPYKILGPCGDIGIYKWAEAGLHANKTVLGFSYRGWAWTLADENNHDYGAPTTGPAKSPDRSYTQIKNSIKDDGAVTQHNPFVVGDYCYSGKLWISYDDNQTIVRKVRFAKQRVLLGYFAWDVSADDDCGLSRAASQAWDFTKKTT